LGRVLLARRDLDAGQTFYFEYSKENSSVLFQTSSPKLLRFLGWRKRIGSELGACNKCNNDSPYYRAGETD
jgi:hypothetical protein